MVFKNLEKSRGSLGENVLDIFREPSIRTGFYRNIPLGAPEGLLSCFQSKLMCVCLFPFYP